MKFYHQTTAGTLRKCSVRWALPNFMALEPERCPYKPAANKPAQKNLPRFACAKRGSWLGEPVFSYWVGKKEEIRKRGRPPARAESSPAAYRLAQTMWSPKYVR
jgi:hypothetical protein